MNRPAYYVYRLDNANKVYGPFVNRADADSYVSGRPNLAITILTGNEILRARIKVTAP